MLIDIILSILDELTLVLTNLGLSYFENHRRPRTDGFWQSQLIRISTVFHSAPIILYILTCQDWYLIALFRLWLAHFNNTATQLSVPHFFDISIKKISFFLIWKMLILLTNVVKKSLETVFDCHLSPDRRQMAIENTVSSAFWSVFVNC